MKLEISLAKLNGKYFIADVEYDDHTLQVSGGRDINPKVACQHAAKTLRDAAIRFDALAEELEPANHKTHNKINRKRL